MQLTNGVRRTPSPQLEPFLERSSSSRRFGDGVGVHRGELHQAVEDLDERGLAGTQVSRPSLRCVPVTACPADLASMVAICPGLSLIGTWTFDTV